MAGGKIKNDEALQNFLEMQYELYLQDIPILAETTNWLRDHGYIKPDPVRRISKSKFTKTGFFIPDKPTIFEEELDQDVNKFYEIVDINKDKTYPVYMGNFKPVKEREWAPASINFHSPNFVKWIDSIREDASNMVYYKPYEKYKAQAEQWYAENVDVTDIGNDEARTDAMMQEFERCDINSLYALNKYFYYQDEFSLGGRSKYFATNYYEHQKVICYLFDCGYSLLMGKPRQFGGTTIFGMLAINRMLARANYYIKFVTEDKEKGWEIFDDKIKFAFYSLPEWFIPYTTGRPDVLNDREGFLRLGRKGQKGRIEGLNSRIRITAPSNTAINGGSPTLVLIDEVGSIDNFSTMMNEGRPTMFKRNPLTGKMEQKRQVIGWGTGTSSKGGAAFEKEYKKARAAWVKGDYTYGVIPLFFNWTTRCDEEEYLSQKRYYYGARAKEENIDQETSRVQFHQHYPTDEEDMFSTTEKVLYPRDRIRAHVRRIDAMPDDKRPIFGFFEPVYDRDHPLTHPLVPFKIIGSEFVQTDEDDFRAHTTILIQPKPNWKNRWFAGTDPIAADDGLSNMSTTIWDKHLKMPVCLTSFREPNDPNTNFMQSLLTCLYYDPDNRIGIPELIEKNIGLAYKQFKQNLLMDKNLIYESELPENLISSLDGIGVDNKGNRAKVIINKLGEVISIYDKNINIRNYFSQLRMFVSKVTRSGNQTWGTADPRYYKDDDLFSLTFAYIAAETSYRPPQYVGGERTNSKVRYKKIYDQNMNLRRIPVTQKIKSDEQEPDNRERLIYSSR